MTPQDYDGDGRTDVTVYRSSTGEWLTLRSSTQTATGWWWGAPALQDQPVPADYDGDGRADIAVYRRSTGEWFFRRTSDNVSVRHHWGSPIYGDLPVPADYDGDGQTDMAIYRQATGVWVILRSSAGYMVDSWGSPDYADVPVPGDYDGDGKADVAVYRSTTGEWFVHRSTNGALFRWTWGDPAQGDVPVPADFDGDSVLDMSVYRTSTGEWDSAAVVGRPSLRPMGIARQPRYPGPRRLRRRRTCRRRGLSVLVRPVVHPPLVERRVDHLGLGQPEHGRLRARVLSFGLHGRTSAHAGNSPGPGVPRGLHEAEIRVSSASVR